MTDTIIPVQDMPDVLTGGATLASPTQANDTGGTVDKVKPRVKLTGDINPVTVLIEQAVETPPTTTEPDQTPGFARLKNLANQEERCVPILPTKA